MDQHNWSNLQKNELDPTIYSDRLQFNGYSSEHSYGSQTTAVDHDYFSCTGVAAKLAPLRITKVQQPSKVQPVKYVFPFQIVSKSKSLKTESFPHDTNTIMILIKKDPKAAVEKPLKRQYSVAPRVRN
ncbi:unnamed protein product [Caenorhabditis auriculariae]|uniref:Uncharacterized protein n=1 Tax=Caenorhabditis auriculariae TaxID=2777116 RepID=A0A8S1H631_9PELO|nr:unnamed protein product [Caenorhabditis auriculariae]